MTLRGLHILYKLLLIILMMQLTCMIRYAIGRVHAFLNRLITLSGEI